MHVDLGKITQNSESVIAKLLAQIRNKWKCTISEEKLGLSSEITATDVVVRHYAISLLLPVKYFYLI